jgi:hypothetical protein
VRGFRWHFPCLAPPNLTVVPAGSDESARPASCGHHLRSRLGLSPFDPLPIARPADTLPPVASFASGHRGREPHARHRIMPSNHSTPQLRARPRHVPSSLRPPRMPTPNAAANCGMPERPLSRLPRALPRTSLRLRPRLPSDISHALQGVGWHAPPRVHLPRILRQLVACPEACLTLPLPVGEGPAPHSLRRARRCDMLAPS